jgi:hypothetical protein
MSTVYRCPAPDCVSPRLALSCSVEQWLPDLLALVVGAEVVEGPFAEVVDVEDELEEELELFEPQEARPKQSAAASARTARRWGMGQGYGRTCVPSGMSMKRSLMNWDKMLE